MPTLDPFPSLDPLPTPRLLLRPFEPDDAPALQQLASDRAIADAMISIPHPYTLPYAQDWLQRQRHLAARRQTFTFAVIHRQSAQLIGSLSLRDIEPEHAQVEYSFWIGRPYWGRGYATEAGHRALAFAFDALALNRIYAYHMVRNPASGAVLRKLGMRQEGYLRQRVRKWGVFEDVILCAILRQDWPSQTAASQSNL